MSPVDDSSNVIPHGAVQTILSVGDTSSRGHLVTCSTWSLSPANLLPTLGPGSRFQEVKRASEVRRLRGGKSILEMLQRVCEKSVEQGMSLEA